LNLVHVCLVLMRGRCRLVTMPEGGTRVELWIPDRGVARLDVPGAADTLAAADIALSEAALVGVACDGAEVVALARDALAGNGHPGPETPSPANDPKHVTGR
jgi:hypothetical protein